MAEFVITANRWNVRVNDAHTFAEYEIDGAMSQDEAKAEAARRWAAGEDRQKNVDAVAAAKEAAAMQAEGEKTLAADLAREERERVAAEKAAADAAKAEAAKADAASRSSSATSATNASVTSGGASSSTTSGGKSA